MSRFYRKTALDDDKFLSKMLTSKKSGASEYDVYLSKMIKYRYCYSQNAHFEIDG